MWSVHSPRVQKLPPGHSALCTVYKCPPALPAGHSWLWNTHPPGCTVLHYLIITIDGTQVQSPYQVPSLPLLTSVPKPFTGAGT